MSSEDTKASKRKAQEIAEEEEPPKLSFEELEIWSRDCLKRCGRIKCEKCGHHRRYYCYDCCVPLLQPGDDPTVLVPKVSLPIPVDM
mmetsp:Transcript_22397/g.37015  ORF Transcript_22397/g.37015 Transcript_22397/m.37015 type:complete len:87 (+) Transcript_22397:1697-1957(+)